MNADWSPSKARLTDLAVLSFVASLAFMALEMVAGRLVTRHLGSSIYGWTSVIGVLLGGLSLGNYLGGKVADRIHRRAAGELAVPDRLDAHALDPAAGDAAALARDQYLGDGDPILSQAISLTELTLPGGKVIAARVAGPRVADGGHGGLPPPLGRDGNGQPGRGQARGRPAAGDEADGHGHRPGLRLGDGRQHPRDVPDRASS